MGLTSRDADRMVEIVGDLMKRYPNVHREICDTMLRYNVNPEEGRTLMAILVGISYISEMPRNEIPPKSELDIYTVCVALGCGIAIADRLRTN